MKSVFIIFLLSNSLHNHPNYWVNTYFPHHYIVHVLHSSGNRTMMKVNKQGKVSNTKKKSVHKMSVKSIGKEQEKTKKTVWTRKSWPGSVLKWELLVNKKQADNTKSLAEFKGVHCYLTDFCGPGADFKMSSPHSISHSDPLAANTPGQWGFIWRSFAHVTAAKLPGKKGQTLW